MKQGGKEDGKVGRISRMMREGRKGGRKIKTLVMLNLLQHPGREKPTCIAESRGGILKQVQDDGEYNT
ncbi:MAG: hypothetical protein EOO88_31815 [Pedobacter sp.]|nr:MAG: hypothetical protein EOO88_31815 [Pedobacter sp.]